MDTEKRLTPETPETPETSTRDQLLTYEVAAKRLGVRHSTVKQLDYRDVFHPVVISGSPFKYVTTPHAHTQGLLGRKAQAVSSHCQNVATRVKIPIDV